MPSRSSPLALYKHSLNYVEELYPPKVRGRRVVLLMATKTSSSLRDESQWAETMMLFDVVKEDSSIAVKSEWS